MRGRGWRRVCFTRKLRGRPPSLSEASQDCGRTPGRYSWHLVSETTPPKRPAVSFRRHDQRRSTALPSVGGMAAAGSGNEENGGVSTLSEVGKHQLRLERGGFSGVGSSGSYSSSVSSASDVDAHSLSSAQDSAASTLSEPDPIVSNGEGLGSSDSVLNGVGTAARSRQHKRGLSDDGPRVVEQETPSNGQQLRKACDLCTKVCVRTASQTDSCTRCWPTDVGWPQFHVEFSVVE